MEGGDTPSERKDAQGDYATCNRAELSPAAHFGAYSRLLRFAHAVSLAAAHYLVARRQ